MDRTESQICESVIQGVTRVGGSKKWDSGEKVGHFGRKNRTKVGQFISYNTYQKPSLSV